MTALRAITLTACAALLGAALSAGCSPSYRGQDLEASIRKICADEHHFDVSVKRVGGTLAIYLHKDGVLTQDGGQVTLAPSAYRILGQLLEAVHRVILSSDVEVKFYVALFSDPAVPGIYLTLVRYLDDVRRVNASIIPPTEFFSRTVLDLKNVGVTNFTLDQLALSDITLEQFLSWQLAKRLQGKLSEQLLKDDVPAEVGPCLGEFKNGEFAFVLNVTPKGDAAASEKTVQTIFHEAATVIAQVFSGYRFDRYQAVRLIHPSTGRSLLLPKTRLELFR